jgi:hypothetical protein
VDVPVHRRFSLCCVTLIASITALAAAPTPWYQAVHQRALKRAQVWMKPRVTIPQARLDANPPGDDTIGEDQTVDCRFVPGGIAGSTPKFDCRLKDGDKVKIKYGQQNPEVFTEVAATRLLSALGFPADRMYVVAGVNCAGCPPDPFPALQCINDGKSVDQCFPNIDYSKVEHFTYAVVERPIDGRRVESPKERGWKWEELRTIDPAAGGAPRAHVDALRLVAVVLGHWDNKAKNQRLLCLGEPDPPDRERDRPPTCRQPLAMVQDLGATFGPEKLDLENWAAMPVWQDAASCRVSMKALPYGGSTFPDWQISEDGRRFLSDLLTQLSRQQIRGLFAGARFDQFAHPQASGRDLDGWVRAFEAKVRAIADRPPCPAQS